MKNIAENIDPWPLKEEAAQLFFEDGGKWNIEEIYGGSLDYWTNINGQVEAGTVDLQVQADTVKDIHSKISKQKLAAADILIGEERKGRIWMSN